MKKEICYIGDRICTGARFSFCDDCIKAQRNNADAICKAKTPLQVTLAHIPRKTK